MRIKNDITENTRRRFLFFFLLNNSCKICCQDHCFTDDDGRKQFQEVVKCDIKRWLLV